MNPAPELRVLPAVAREAITARLDDRPMRGLPEPRGALADPAPVFVTLRIDGALRGCIGELDTRHEDLVAEVEDRACAAAFEDSRFPPLTAVELPRCTIEVSLLGRFESVASEHELDPTRYGVDGTDADGRYAILLPDIPGVDTVTRQLAILRRKAGIAPGAAITLRRFEVVKITESSR